MKRSVRDFFKINHNLQELLEINQEPKQQKQKMTNEFETESIQEKKQEEPEVETSYREKFEQQIRSFNLILLKEKAKENEISTKLEKEEMISELLRKYDNIVYDLNKQNVSEIKTFCKEQKLKFGLTKTKMMDQIMEINASCKDHRLLSPMKEKDIQRIPEAVPIIAIESEKKTINNKDNKKVPNTTTKREEKEKEKKEEEQIQKEKEKERNGKMEKEKKEVIKKKIKIDVWNTYVDQNVIKHRCLCCKKAWIENTNFHCGHVISENNGGTLEISNLRPICAACNYSMGTENMQEFIKKYGYYY
jgi:hypothetical protein